MNIYLIDAWARVIEEVHGQNAKMVIRHAFHHTSEGVDEEKLQQAVVSLDERYELRQIHQPLYEQALTAEWNGRRWASDWCGQYRDYEDYQKNGLGVAILHDGELVAGASAYSYYRDGIEIQIDTREDHRRRDWLMSVLRH